MKKTLCLLLSVFLLLGALPLAAHGETVVASGITPAGCDWTLTDDGTLTVTGTGPTGHGFLTDGQKRQVKKIIIDEGITEISDWSFYGCDMLQSVLISDSVSVIGNNAFENCSLLKSIALPKNLKEIGNSAFESCITLTAVSFPYGLESIGERSFYHCDSLSAELIIPASVHFIGGFAFDCCSKLTAIYLPETITSIQDWTFFLGWLGNRITTNCTSGHIIKNWRLCIWPYR